MEQSIEVALPQHSYQVTVGTGVISRAGEIIRARAPHAKAALFSDRNACSTCRQDLIKSLQDSGFSLHSEIIDSGESRKNLDSVSRLYDILIEHKFERSSPIIAFGGGVAGDMVGFAAATYLRGVPFIQVPTTLLAMVDASIGGKVAVNHAQGKNLIGAFHQPQAVIIDTRVLQTLPDREFKSGLAECIKHGLLGDGELFRWTAAHTAKIASRDAAALTELIGKNVAFKAGIVAADERESGVRALLNLGHTFAHAIEATAGYGKFLHGEAVALGLCAAAHVSAARGMCPGEVPAEVEKLLHAVGLPTRAELPAVEVLMQAMKLDKKVKDGAVRLILLDGIGSARIVDDCPDALIRSAWNYLSA